MWPPEAKVVPSTSSLRDLAKFHGILRQDVIQSLVDGVPVKQGAGAKRVDRKLQRFVVHIPMRDWWNDLYSSAGVTVAEDSTQAGAWLYYRVLPDGDRARWIAASWFHAETQAIRIFSWDEYVARWKAAEAGESPPDDAPKRLIEPRKS